MSSKYTLNISAEKAKEMPMVDLAFLVLKSANVPFYYRDLMKEIAKIKKINKEAVNDVIAQLYTEINIDGRFACVGTNLWGLKRWYPVEKAGDAVGNAKRPRIINDEDDDEEEELLEEVEELDADESEDDEDYDKADDADDVDEDMDEDIEEIDEDLEEDLDDSDNDDEDENADSEDED